MSDRDDPLKTALREVCIMGLTAARRPHDLAARAALRRACLHGNAVLRAECAWAEAEALAPGDPRPAAPLPDSAPATPNPPAPRAEPRLPYRDD